MCCGNETGQFANMQQLLARLYLLVMTTIIWGVFIVAYLLLVLPALLAPFGMSHTFCYHITISLWSFVLQNLIFTLSSSRR